MYEKCKDMHQELGEPSGENRADIEKMVDLK